MPADAAPAHLLVAELGNVGDRPVLSASEVHYLARVCRARPGDVTSATDGKGGIARLRVASIQPEVVVEIESIERSPRQRMAMVMCGAPEGERGDWLIEKLAELGVGIFQPVDGARGAWPQKDKRHDRWQRLAEAALRQARRRFMMEIRGVLPLREALAQLPEGARRWIADPNGVEAGSLSPTATGFDAGLIGPSGGWSEAEADLVRNLQFAPIYLSDARLRTETAALAWASWWSGGAKTPSREPSAAPVADATREP